ncbi:CHAP domain-containing protein [Staphylococcus aureus]|nr:CHAP domain-containing protein [Staphylococcus aureus]
MISLTRQPFYENTVSFQALPGDVVIFNRNYGGGYGHVGIVISATLDSINYFRAETG